MISKPTDRPRRGPCGNAENSIITDCISQTFRYDERMKRIFLLSLLLFSILGLFVQAEGPDDQYVQIYRLIQAGDQLRASGESQLAQEKYVEAQSGLKKLKLSYPNWNENVIEFRLNYVTEKLNSLSRPKPAAVLAEKPLPVPVRPSSGPAAAAATPEDGRVNMLMEEVRRLQSANAVLEAKLKEAFTARPAAVEPRELERAELRIRLLEKEKELLQVTLDQEQARPSPLPDTGVLEQMKSRLAEATQSLARQTEIAVALTREKEILQARLDASGKEVEAARSLRAENETLRKRMEQASSSVQAPSEKPTAGPAGAAIETVVTGLQNALRTLQGEKSDLEKTKRELEMKLALASSSVPRPATGESDRVRLLESERDELLKRLNGTTKQIYDNKARTEQVQRDQYEGQLAGLRARLEVLEARRVPYTPEELALFKQPPLAATKVDPKSGRKSLRELPRGAGPLLAEAERAFASRRFDEAEKKYVQVLRLDGKNVFTLANLAASQLEQNRLADAEGNLVQALAIDPTDPHGLSLLGILKFRQEKYDDALDSLSRAAQVDPQNPETQNYLGITLSQKGQRAASEAALRRAIQLAPGYGGAHHNLAVIYATQQPPFTELARWHYQKALASGHPQNAALEKMIEEGRSAQAPK